MTRQSSSRFGALAPWLACVLMAALIALQISLLLDIRLKQTRPRFVAIPHSITLDKAGHKAAGTVHLPELAGMTVDDLVRGMLHLAGKLPPAIDNAHRLTPTQAHDLLPSVARLNTMHARLMDLRQARHEANEASMEDALAVGDTLSNTQLERILAAAPGDALTEAEWIGLMERLGGDS
ncbi:MAG: hypothetical protein H6685_13280 [Deltaproteobacteria bacterium]|nr:hypothetical protein [Deltaproteobacteria bacterium]